VVEGNDVRFAAIAIGNEGEPVAMPLAAEPHRGWGIRCARLTCCCATNSQAVCPKCAFVAKLSVSRDFSEGPPFSCFPVVVCQANTGKHGTSASGDSEVYDLQRDWIVVGVQHANDKGLFQLLACCVGLQIARDDQERCWWT
jgi:hypothetical protein